jgi:anti-anti-sigma regulatory factor
MIEPLPKLAVAIEWQGESLSLAGDLAAVDAEALEQWFCQMASNETPRRLELAELDITDGVAATHMINIVRLILGRYGEVCLSEAPQLLAHNLYRAGLFYEGSGITLEGMREDEPYG